MTDIVFIPDVIREVVDKTNERLARVSSLNVQYKHGEIDDVLTDLIQKEGNPNKPEKYPLLWLVTPFTAKVDAERKMAFVDEMQFILAHRVPGDMAIEDSDEEIVKPILLPICGALCDELMSGKRTMLMKANQNAGAGFTYSTHRKAKNAKDNKPILYDYVDYLDIRFQNMIIKNIC